jgi:Kef-type K+ transport system membrane component KefB
VSFELRMLIAFAVVILATRIVGSIAARIGQPRLIGEIVAGIVLGPTVLGAVVPGVTGHLFAPDVVLGLQLVANLGLVIFMFLVGMEVDLAHMRSNGRRVVLLGQASIAVPFALGFVTGLAFHDRFAEGASPMEFALFTGAAVGVTAFPVLARILQETGLFRTRIGSTTISCAALNDIAAWCLLAVAVVAGGSGTSGDIVVMITGLVAFLALMIGVVKPLLRRFGRPSLWSGLMLMLVSAAATQLIGVHAIFGAFVAGLVLSRGSDWMAAVHDRLEPVSSSLFLPVLFAVVGLSTEFGLLDNAAEWGFAGIVLLVAICGKVGGSLVGARLSGETWRDATIIGVLMNTRGLTEIVILKLGLELRLIGPVMFAIMILVALVTTAMTMPLVTHLIRDRSGRPDLDRVAITACERPSSSTRPREPDEAPGRVTPRLGRRRFRFHGGA